MIRVATDVGGTFTDLVGLETATGRVFTAKALTTPDDPSRGVTDALRQAGLDAGRLADVSFMVHGGTTVINAILERKGVRTAFLTTAGFRDILAIGRGNRPDLYNLRSCSPASFVPRHLCFEVEERMDAKGAVRQALSTASLARATEAIEAEKPDALAIMFLHAYANPEHERLVASVLRARFPAMAIVASHEVSRRWREYERGTTAVLSAYVQPIMGRYLATLEAALREWSYAGSLYVMRSNAGLATVAAARANPLALVESGPAGGVAGAADAVRRLGIAALLHLDVGGTTAKCSLVIGGRPTLKTDYKLEWTRINPGYPVQVPVVDIVEIGAGGGSIVRLDAGGAMLVGPDSAGADPGPACYGRGGQAPTITDAKLLTGVLDPERFADALRLDRAAAERAFLPLANQLGLSVSAVADAALQVAEAKMIDALKLITVQRGHDPRDMALLVSGGAGPMHAASLGRELGVASIVVPPLAGLFSAYGMLMTAPRVDLSRTLLMAADPAGFAQALVILATLAAEAARELDAEASSRLEVLRTIEMRYRGQEHTVSVDVGPEVDSLDRLLAAFHAAHQKAYTFRLEDTAVELVTYHVAVEQPAPGRGPSSPLAGDRSVEAAARPPRRIFTGGGFETARVFDRDLLPRGAPIDGPVLIEEATTTTLVLAGQRIRVDETGFLVIEEQGVPPG